MGQTFDLVNIIRGDQFAGPLLLKIRQTADGGKIAGFADGGRANGPWSLWPKRDGVDNKFPDGF